MNRHCRRTLGPWIVGAALLTLTVVSPAHGDFAWIGPSMSQPSPWSGLFFGLLPEENTVEEYRSLSASAAVVSGSGSASDSDVQEFHSSFKIFNAPQGEIVALSARINYFWNYQPGGNPEGFVEVKIGDQWSGSSSSPVQGGNYGQGGFDDNIDSLAVTLAEGEYDLIIRLTASAFTSDGRNPESMSIGADVYFGHPVPEPSSVALVALGAVGLLGLRWRWPRRA